MFKKVKPDVCIPQINGLTICLVSPPGVRYSNHSEVDTRPDRAAYSVIGRRQEWVNLKCSVSPWCQKSNYNKAGTVPGSLRI